MLSCYPSSIYSAVTRISLYEETRTLGRPRRRWEDNIKIDLQEVGCGGMDGLIWLSIGQVAGTGECGNEHSGSIKCGEFLDRLKTGGLFKKDSAVWSM